MQEGLDSNVQALRFDGTNFVPFGPPINERTFGSQLGLAIDRNGLIYVVLEQLAASGGNAEILVRRYDAAANVWQTIGPSFPTGRALANSSRPRLAIDATNRPVISFFNGANGVLEAFRFDAAAWASLGGAPGINGLNQHLALNSAGNPVVAYLRSPFPFVSQLDVAEHNGVAWVTLGTLEVSGNSVPLGPPQIALAADGRPWVAWHRLGQPNVTLARYDGTTFVTVPITPALTTVNGLSALTFLNGDPVVAGIVSLSAGRVDLHRFRGGAWEPAVSIRAQVDLLNLLPDGNSLVVSHVNGTGNGRVSRVVFP